MASLPGILRRRLLTLSPLSPQSPAKTWFSPRPVVRICGICRPLMRRRPSLPFRLALSTPNAACLPRQVFRRTMRYRTVAAGSPACRAGLFVSATSPLGHIRLLKPPWYLRLRAAATVLPQRRSASRMVAGLPLILAWRRAAASCSRLPCTSPCIHAASMTWVPCSYCWPGSSPGRVHGPNCCSPLGLVA